jgi:phosphoglycolate phosphatase-like HAD superfamily hydrolase
MTAIRPIEIVRPDFPRGGFKAAMFDFDGTLSLLRGSWQPMMIDMMVDLLAATPQAESPDALRTLVVDYVQRLTGKPTIVQMQRLTEELARRGGEPLTAEQYQQQYLEQLDRLIETRIDALDAGHKTLEELTIAGAAELLERLHERGVSLWLASGTDRDCVVRELGILGLDRWFGRCVFGALPPPGKFSKAVVVEQILRDHKLQGRELIGIGDGFVEIQEIVRVGGLAIGVASNEQTREGIDPEKRRWLIEAGAHLIIGDYRHTDELLQTIGLAG